MLKRFMVVAAVVTGLLGTAREAEAQVFEGDPFVEPIPLAGSWHYLDEDIAPADAAAADLSTWKSMEIPGRRPSGGAGPIGWYGIDVKLPPRAEWPSPATELVLAPPFFLFAYEVYVGDQLIGASGALPPDGQWGPVRHRWFVIPEGALPASGPLRLRLRVWGWTAPFRGTGLRCMSEGIVLGKHERVSLVVDWVNERQRSSRPWRPYLAGAFVVLAAVFALFGISVRREPGLLWLTIALASLAITQVLNIDIGLREDPGPIAIGVSVASGVFVLAVLLFLRRVFEIDTKAAKAMTWAAAIALTARAGGFLAQPPGALALLAMAFTLLVGAYALAVAVRKAGSGRPDARILAVGAVVAAIAIAVEPAASAAAVLAVLPWRTYLLSFPVSDGGYCVVALTMSLVIARRYARSLRDLEASFVASHRFVPERFLSLLGRDKITEVQRADATEQRMAVLFADIRGFTTRSEAVGAESTFALVNRYLEAVEPAIHEQGGFINKFLGDGILALFPDAASGLAGARALQRAVAELNRALQEEGEEPIQVGVGLHVGTVMLGTVGGTKQLDTSVIADAVNTASRIESLTKRYGVDILVTSILLEEAGERTGTRELDQVLVVGRQEPVTLHEVDWQAEDHADRDAAYSKALQAYRQGDLSEALAAFKSLAESDPASQRMSQQTEALLERGVPDSWRGVTRLAEK